MVVERRMDTWASFATILSLAAVGLLAGSAPGGATHADGTYDLPVVTSARIEPLGWYRPLTVVHDVIIVPPHHGQVFNLNGPFGGEPATNELDPFATSYLRAVEDSVEEWQTAIDAFGAPWYAGHFTVRSYVLGRDDIPQEVLEEPETVIVADDYKTFVLGVAFRGFMLGYGPCVVDNSMFGTIPLSFTYFDMFNVNAQEFGHCLGASHVEGNHPAHDAMAGSYADTPGGSDGHLHCVSNLDVLATQAAAQHLYGFPIGPERVSIPVDLYRTTDCTAVYGP